jgi:hypothetical protein
METAGALNVVVSARSAERGTGSLLRVGRGRQSCRGPTPAMMWLTLAHGATNNHLQNRR